MGCLARPCGVRVLPLVPSARGEVHDPCRPGGPKGPPMVGPAPLPHLFGQEEHRRRCRVRGIDAEARVVLLASAHSDWMEVPVQAQLTITPVPPETTRPQPRVSATFAYVLAGLAIASIWISVVLTSVLAPDFVSGSQQEHLPLVGFTAWLWGAIATGFVVLTALEGTRSGSFERAAWVAPRGGCQLGLAWRSVAQRPGTGLRDRERSDPDPAGVDGGRYPRCVRDVVRLPVREGIERTASVSQRYDAWQAARAGRPARRRRDHAAGLRDDEDKPAPADVGPVRTRGRTRSAWMRIGAACTRSCARHIGRPSSSTPERRRALRDRVRLPNRRYS